LAHPIEVRPTAEIYVGFFNGTTNDHTLHCHSCNPLLVGAFADTIQRAHKNCKKKKNMQYLCFFFSIIERSVMMALIFYYKDMLEKVTMQRTQQFSVFSFLPKEPSYMQCMRSKSKDCD